MKPLKKKETVFGYRQTLGEGERREGKRSFDAFLVVKEIALIPRQDGRGEEREARTDTGGKRQS